MRLDRRYVVYAELNDETVQHEEYALEVPAASHEEAEKAGRAACEVLGLSMLAVTEKDW